jgi:CheY-like chemotaxis protein
MRAWGGGREPLQRHHVALATIRRGSGLEVCRRLKTDPDTAALLAVHVSATATCGSDRLQALEHGADTYLVEPVETEELIATIRALLRLREAETALRERDRLLHAILEHTPVVLFMKATDGHYLLANREYGRLAGRPMAELKGNTYIAKPVEPAELSAVVVQQAEQAQFRNE